MTGDSADILQKRTISTKVIYENNWIKIHEDITVGPRGEQGLYSYLESPNSCMVVAVNDNREIFLVRNYRYPSKSYGWELPGGGGENEDPLVASQRELEEETGILAKRWKAIGSAHVCNGLMTERTAFHLATDLSFDGVKEDSDEVFSDMKFFSINQINQMILDGEINDSQTISGLHYYQLQK